MKKILLIIILTLAIFQMVVLAVDIDIGSAAINRGSITPNTRTLVNKDNPANASGEITVIEIWVNTTLSSCEVATFYEVAANVLSTRDTEAIGTVTAGSKQIFNVNLTVEEGDYIGLYGAWGYVEKDSSGFAGVWYTSTDNIPCTAVSFGSYSGDTISLYGMSPAEEEEEEENVIFFGTNF